MNINSSNLRNSFSSNRPVSLVESFDYSKNGIHLEEDLHYDDDNATSPFIAVSVESPLTRDQQRNKAQNNPYGWSFWVEMIVILLVLFVAESSRGMVVPTLSLYVESLGSSEKMLGLVIGSYSFGRLFGSVVLGWMYNKLGANRALLFSIILSIAGNLLYSIGAVTNIWVLLLSRVLTGFSTGVLSISRAFIAERTTDQMRTRFISYSTAVQYMGFALMPGTATLLSYFNFSLMGILPVNQYTSPGYVLTLLNIIMFFVVLIFLPHRPIKEEDEEVAVGGLKNVSMRVFYIGLGLFISLNLVARGVLSILETYAAPVFMDVWDDTDGDAIEDTSKMLLILGCLGLIIFFLLDHICRIVKEHILLIVSFVLIGLGSLILLDFDDDLPLWRFLTGAVLVWSVGSPIVQTLIISAFSKILGSKPQGTMMGYIGSAGSVGRIVLPILCGFIGPNPSFILSAVLCLICTIAIMAYMRYVRKNRT